MFLWRSREPLSPPPPLGFSSFCLHFSCLLFGAHGSSSGQPLPTVLSLQIRGYSLASTFLPSSQLSDTKH